MINTSDYIYYNGELFHAKTQHKYVARVKTSKGKYRYFYSMNEYKAYMSGKDTPKVTKDTKDKKESKSNSVSKFFKNVFNKVSKLFKKSKKEVAEALESGKKFIDEVIFGKKKGTKSLFEDAKKKVKYIAKIKLPNGKYRYFYEQEDYDRYLAKQKYQENEPDFMKNIPEISGDKSCLADDDMAEINEDYSRYDKATSQNCTNCTAAYELRCRGYDVSAAEYENYVTSYDNASMLRFPLYYKNAKTIRLDDAGNEHKSPLNNTVLYKRYEYDSRTVTEAILKHSGKNTRGDISVMWKDALAGHSMVYEVDGKGKVTIRDCQTNKTYSVESIVKHVNGISITRTDNLELRKGILDAVKQNGG